MNLRLPAACFAATLIAVALAAAPAHAGSLTVRDAADGSQWSISEDPAEDAEDFLLKHGGADRRPDLHYGRDGQTAFQLGADNDAPTALRIDQQRRAWAVGATMSGNQPQPVVVRFGADGNVDPRWGVQGKVQGGPVGTPIRPNDLLPLADGSVLVAGQSPGAGGPKPVVYHLMADGRIDATFGNGGVWQRPGTESGVASGLATAPDGTIAVSVALHGPKPSIEIWALNDKPPTLLSREANDDVGDEDDMRTEWAGNHWIANTNGGATGIVPAVTLQRREAPEQTAAAPAPADATNQGGGGFNPFSVQAPSSAPQAAQASDDSGIPWMWIGVAIALGVGVVGVLFVRGGGTPPAPARQNARR